MTKVYFNTAEVQTTLSQLREKYSALNDKLNELSQKNGEVSLFWDCSEASRFNEKISKVNQSFDKFHEKYENYLAFLESVIKAYGDDQESFIATLNSYNSSS